MLRARYIEITRRRWYDVGFLVLISALTGLIRLAGISAGNICYTPFVLITSLYTLYSLALTLSVYLLVNEFTHRHHQAFITAAILASMNALVFLHPQQESTLCSCALLLFSLYLLLKAMRRYGPQWHNMLGSATLLAASILEGGISPLYNIALPFLIITVIAMRPIIHYKKISFPVCSLITIFLISVPAIIHPEPSFTTALLRITDIQGFMIVPLSHYDRAMQILFFLRESGLWIIIGLVSAIYALRSQRIHGDLSALIGVWWFILAIVLIMLHPTRHGATSLSILIPFSFPIGAYFNLLSLPRKLNLRDRRIFRLLLIASALLFVCTTIYYSIFYPSANPLLTVFLFLAFLFLIQIVFIVQHNYKGRKLPVHLTEISFIVFAILFAIGNIQFVFP
jgi:hypothetical protein